MLGRHPWYWRLHTAAARAYAGDPAIRVLRREADATGLAESQLVYGETPTLSILSMLAQVGVSSRDTFIDLGCGRGLTVLAAALSHGVSAVGIDAIPTFIERGNALAERLRIAPRARFIHGNFLDQDITGGTIFYAAATTFEREVIDAMADRVARLGAPNARFITLSHTLLPPWKMIGKRQYPMTWGWNRVYFHRLDDQGE